MGQPLNLRAHCGAWPLAQKFTISRGSKTQTDVVVAEVEANGIVGRAECVPYPRYEETVNSVLTNLRDAREFIGQGGCRDELHEVLPAGAARNALDCAMWDWEAKSTGEPVWRLAGLPPPKPVTTAYTLSLDTPSEMGRNAANNASRPLLKLKLDRTDTIARVRAVRENAPQARLVIDANEAWQSHDLEKWLTTLAELGVELGEQPLPAGKDEALSGLGSPIPIGADESCHVSDDLQHLADRYQLINIKLDKSGGLTEALRLRACALESGMDFMIGCMIGTSLSMAPALLLTPEARFVDLDGPLLLAHDRVPGLEYNGQTISPPSPVLWG